ncbi:unnamed protein product, partial [Ectocarpus sp. 12 AP-2014]
ARRWQYRTLVSRAQVQTPSEKHVADLCQPSWFALCVRSVHLKVCASMLGEIPGSSCHCSFLSVSAYFSTNHSLPRLVARAGSIFCPFFSPSPDSLSVSGQFCG